MDIKAIVTMENIPNDMVVNWDQAAIKYIPLLRWLALTTNVNNSHIFCITIWALFTCVEGKTTKCHPLVEFPEGWHVIHTPNYWRNEETMITYI